jgi:FemAB-related protein (PEP-CTERM system-associated)
MKTVCLQSDQAAWDAFVQASPEATAYHQYRWKSVIEKSFGHRGYYLAALDEKGTMRGMLPLIQMKSALFGNFLVSVPFVNYGGLVCNCAAAEQALLSGAEQLRCDCQASFVELRHLSRALGGLSTRQRKVTMLLPLAAGVDDQWNSFNPKLRNQIRKAEKNGLQPSVGHLDLLDDFYRVFARNMRDLGTPVYSKDFFRNVLTSFPESTRIFAVALDRKTVAAGLAIWFRNTMEVPWASSISDYKPLCPNNMLYWEAIKFGIECGFSTFDFGRSTPGEGTYNFKKQWGAEAVPLHWQYLLKQGCAVPEINTGNSKYRMAIKLWQRLPVLVTKVLGPRIVRSIP